MGAIPALATTRGLRSSAFDRHEEQMKKQLLPKDLAARAEKVPASKVEAEVLRIVSAKPPPSLPSLSWAALGMAQAAQQQVRRQTMDRQARELERLLMADVQQTPFMPQSLNDPPGSLWGF
jgi:hypothetical protein